MRLLSQAKENQVQENAVLQFQNGQSYNVGDCHGELSLLNLDDFSNVNEMRIKVLSSYPSANTLTFDVQWIKKHISGQKHCFDAVESCCQSDLINK